jgi:hypothetical protein
MTDRDLMQQALDALKGVLDDSPKVLDASISGGLYEVIQCREAITVLQARLAHCDRCGKRLGEEGDIHTCTPKPEQEPVAYLCENAVGHKYFRWKKPSSTYKPIALYTAPPQRKPLTDEQIFACENSVPDEIVSDRVWCIYFARAIEAAHDIKENTCQDQNQK